MKDQLPLRTDALLSVIALCLILFGLVTLARGG